MCGKRLPTGISERSKRDRAQQIPASYIQFRPFGLEKRNSKLNDQQKKCELDYGGNAKRKLGPLQRLAVAGQHQGPSAQHSDKVENAEQIPAQPLAGNRTPREQRHRVIEKGNERIAQPRIENALRVVIAQPAPRVPSMSAEKRRRIEFDRNHQPEQSRQKQSGEGGIGMRPNQRPRSA